MAKLVGHIQNVDSVGVPDVVVGRVASEIGREPVGESSRPVGERPVASVFREFRAVAVGVVIGVPRGGGCLWEHEEDGKEDAEDRIDGRHLVERLQQADLGKRLIRSISGYTSVCARWDRGILKLWIKSSWVSEGEKP